MPKSKRAKVVHLSKTTKKGKELTLRLFANIREAIPKYPYIYVFSVDNMRNTFLKDVRTELSDSRFVFQLSNLFYEFFWASEDNIKLKESRNFFFHFRTQANSFIPCK